MITEQKVREASEGLQEPCFSKTLGAVRAKVELKETAA